MPELSTRRKSDACTNWRDGSARDLMSDRMVEQQAGGRGDGGDRADLRLHRHRRRLGRLRGGIAPVRIRPPSRAAAGSRAARSQPLDPHPPRLRQDLCRSGGELEVRDANRSRSLATAASICRAARRLAGPARSTAWSISAATTATTTNGASAAARAGTGIRSCRTSRRRRTRPAAPMTSTASAARCTFPTSRAASNSPMRCWRPACRPASRAIPTSTARSRKVAATTRPPR